MSDLYEIKDNNFNYYHYEHGSNFIIKYCKHITHARQRTRTHSRMHTHIYASKKTESQVDMKKAKRMTLFNIMINVSRNGIKAIMKNDPIKYLQKTRRKCGFRAHRQV